MWPLHRYLRMLSPNNTDIKEVMKMSNELHKVLFFSLG